MNAKWQADQMLLKLIDRIEGNYSLAALARILKISLPRLRRLLITYDKLPGCLNETALHSVLLQRVKFEGLGRRIAWLLQKDPGYFSINELRKIARVDKSSIIAVVDRYKLRQYLRKTREPSRLKYIAIKSVLESKPETYTMEDVAKLTNSTLRYVHKVVNEQNLWDLLKRGNKCQICGADIPPIRNYCRKHIRNVTYKLPQAEIKCAQCGKQVKTALEHVFHLTGQAYFFCSRACKVEWLKTNFEIISREALTSNFSGSEHGNRPNSPGKRTLKPVS